MRAYLMTPREEFVTAANLDRAYEWHHLNIGFGVTITGPHTVARMTNTLEDQARRQGARDRHRLGLPVRLSFEPHAQRLVDRDHPRRSPKRTRALYDSLIARGYSEYRAIRTRNADGYYGWAENRAVRQDHRHLRHRSHSRRRFCSSSTPDGIMVIPVGPPGAQHVLKARQAAVARRRTHGRALRHLRRRDHSVRAVHGIAPVLRPRGRRERKTREGP